MSAPRIHCEGDTLEIEARFEQSVLAGLEARGHPLRRSYYSYDYTSGRPHVARRSPDGARLDGGADPRGGGMALSV